MAWWRDFVALFVALVLNGAPVLSVPTTPGASLTPLIFTSFQPGSRKFQEASRNSTPSIQYTVPYYERKYSTGWFSSPVILNTHVETSQLTQLLTQRRHSHYPSFVTAHTVEYPTPIVLFNVLWIPNSNNWVWSLGLNLEGEDLQAELDKRLAGGMKPKLIDSYAFVGHGSIYYSVIFISNDSWAPGTKFDIAFGRPKDANYCCGPSSRWATLQRAGLTPASVSVTQFPQSPDLYVADVWNSRSISFWQGDFDVTSGALQSLLAALAPPLVPKYIKSYRETFSNGGYRILYSFVAESDPSIPNFAATVDVSKSGIELLSRILKSPPLFVSSFFLEGEVDPQDPSSGDMYAAVWQGIPPTVAQGEIQMKGFDPKGGLSY